MKNFKIFLFILLAFFSINISSVNADEVTGTVIVTVTITKSDLEPSTPTFSPITVIAGDTVSFSGTITNKNATGTGVDFPYFFIVGVGTGGGAVATRTEIASSTMNALSGNGTGTATGSYTFNTAGTYSFQLVVDKTTRTGVEIPGVGSVVDESDENNNRSNWVTVTVYAPCTTGPVNYIKCGDEGKTCKIPASSNAFKIAYGCNTGFTYVVDKLSGDYTCNQALTGGSDPAPGVVKACFYAEYPTVLAPTISAITSTAARISSNVTDAGNPGFTVSGRGFYWGPQDHPTTGAPSGSGTGSYYLDTISPLTPPLAPLIANTDYWAFSYASNAAGTSYSGQTTFKTAIPTKETPVCTVTNSPKNYTGSNQTPTVTIKNSGGTVVAGNTPTVKTGTAPNSAGTYGVTVDFTPTDTAAYNSLSNASCGDFVINKINQLALTVTPQTVTTPTAFANLTTTGGSGTGTVSYELKTAGAGCSVTKAGVLTYTTTGSCVITATKAGDTNYNLKTADGTFIINPPADACGTSSSITPILNEPTTNTAACNPGTYANSPADTTTAGSQAWKWSCGTVTTCTAPKYGCRLSYDSNYDLSQYGLNGPNNNWGCSGSCENGGTDYPTCTAPIADSCGPDSGSIPRNPEPTGTSACSKGTLNSNSPADITTNGLQEWKWSCGTVNTCHAPKYGCTTTTDSNYNSTGPNNTWSCANTCSNGATNYPTCTLATISFEGNGSTSGSTASQTITTNTSVNLRNNGFLRTNYTFVGWNTNSGGTGINYDNQSNYTIGSSSVILYAKWISSIIDACGTSSSITPILNEPTTNTAACNPGTYANSPADTTTAGSQAWKWSCGTVTTCTAPKYGCRLSYDSNYDLSQYGLNGPNNNWGCSGSCENGGTDYPTCTAPVGPTVTVDASPLTYNVNKGTVVSFTYTSNTTSSNLTECQLLDNDSTPLTSYQSVPPILQSVPFSEGDFGYYIRCRDRIVTTSEATSSMIHVITIPATTGTDLIASDIVVPTVNAGVSTNFTSKINNIGETGTGGGFYDLFAVSTTPNTSGIIDSYTQLYSSGYLDGNDYNWADVNITFASTGTYYIISCADLRQSSWIGINASGDIDESDDNNNCSSWKEVNVVSAGVNGGWTNWSPRSEECPYNGTQTRSCTNPTPEPGGNDCNLLDSDGSLTSKPYSNTECPVIEITGVRSNGTLITSNKKIPYNSNVNIEWSKSNVTNNSCSCVYTDSKVSGVNCLNFTENSPYKTPYLIRDTTYTLSCTGYYGKVVSDSAKILVDVIKTDVIEE